ncbi:hypothetical protein Tco_1412550 [Tanacetum coccineum]
MNMLTNLTMQKQSPSGSGTLHSNTVANLRGDLKAITTRSGVAYDGPTIPPTPSPLRKEVEREAEATKDKEPKVAPKPNPKPSIPYPLRLNDQKLLDYDVDPRVPLILERPFLRTTRALVDVYGEELILRDRDEQLIFHTDTTSKYPNEHIIDGSTTSTPDSSPSLTPVETSDYLLEEFADELALLDPFPLGIGNADFDPEGDIHLLDKLLNNDPSSPLPPKELNFKELKMIKSSIDDFPLLTDDESPLEADVPEESFKIYSNPLFEFDEEYISSNPDLLVTPLSDANKDECFNPGGDIDGIVVSTDIEDDYHDSEGDIIYLENLLNNDPIPYLPPEVFLDHDPRSLKDELDNND